jgi:hypothetical protein
VLGYARRAHQGDAEASAVGHAASISLALNVALLDGLVKTLILILFAAISMPDLGCRSLAHLQLRADNLDEE